MDLGGLEDELRKIVEPLGPIDPEKRKEEVLEALRALPYKSDLLILSVSQKEDGTLTGAYLSLMSDENAKRACLEYLKKIGCIPKGTNAMMDALRDFLPPGHPHKDG
jgi:hypothetical protein